jgi:hypothetical protein
MSTDGVRNNQEATFLFQEAFERLLTKASQPIQPTPAQEAERTSEPRRSDD